MEDIAILTGGLYLSHNLGSNLKSLSGDFEQIEEILGTSEKVVISADKTIIIPTTENIESEMYTERIEELEGALNYTEVAMEKKSLEERLAKLAGVVATIKVGGFTEMEQKEKKDRVDDAIHAVRAAIEEGYVYGGGRTFLNIFKALSIEEDKSKNKLDPSYSRGSNLVINSLLSPFIRLLANKGYKQEEIQKITMEANLSDDEVFNVRTQQFEKNSLIIDPTKVVRLSVENAVSVVKLLINTSCVLV